MMHAKGLLSIVVLLCAVALNTVSAFADIIDDCGSLDVYDYNNFSAVSASSLGWSGVFDDTLLVQGTDNTSSVAYACIGTDRVEIELYSKLPVYASIASDGTLMRSADGSGRLPLLYSPSLDTVYTRYGGALYSCEYDSLTALCVFPNTAADPGDLVAYGLSVQYYDGGYYDAPLSFIGEESHAKCTMQSFSADIPQQAREIIVTLTEQSRIAVSGRNTTVTVKSKGSLALGSVTLHGAEPLAAASAAQAYSAPLQEATAADADASVSPASLTDDEYAHDKYTHDEYADEEYTYDEYYDEALPAPEKIDAQLDARDDLTAEMQSPEPEPPSQTQAAPAAPQQSAPQSSHIGADAAGAEDDYPRSAKSSAERLAASNENGFGGLLSTMERSSSNIVTMALVIALGILAAFRILLGGRKM